MQNLVVDIGNSRIKVGIFKDNKLIKSSTLNSTEELISVLSADHDNLIIASVKNKTSDLIEVSKASNLKIELSHKTALPITIKYSTPETLGVDRVADACGAFSIFPNENCLIIDLGTCINYEVLDSEAKYWGGVISPGMNMRFQAMNTFTARLPLLEPTTNPILVGDSTASCMSSGVMNGILEEMNGFISKIEVKYPKLQVIMTGGDMAFFENQLKHSIFAAPELALLGLNRILIHNVSN